MYQPEAPESPRVSCTLAASEPAVAPGAVTWLAVTLEIADGWHIYWPGQNDTGMTPSFQWKLPEGWQLGQPRWPAPVRHLAPGDLLDHVLEGKPTVLFPLHIPDDAAPAQQVEISCKAQWLVCDEMCLSESATLETTVRVVAGGDKSDNRLPERFRRAFDALPRPLGPDAPVSAEVTDAGALILKASQSGELIFSPGQDGRAPRDILDGCVSDSGELAVIFRDKDARPIEGVVTLRTDSGTVQHFAIRFPKSSSRELDGFEVEIPNPKPNDEENKP